MCVRMIVDASAFRHLCAETPKSAGHQVRDWIEKGAGRVVYSPKDTRYADELGRNRSVRELLHGYLQNGWADEVETGPVQAALDRIPDRPVRRSDDPHVLALAVASDATVLFSCDSKLRQDFGDHRILGKVGRQHRSCVPHLRDGSPEDTTRAGDRASFLAKRRCPFSDG